jgi:two-component system, sensor histidine kinase and response regulator
MNSKKKRILLIDDQPENLYVLKERLNREGYDVITSESGQEGIDLAKNKIPDLIICDIMMPFVNGYDVMKSLRNNPLTATIPFIFLSAKADPKDVREGMMFGADDYITKPFSGKELVEVIKTRLEKREMFEKNIEALRKSITFSIPHELQTPLTGILGFSEILIEDYLNIKRDDLLEIAMNIRSSADRLYSLIQKVLFSVKLDVISKDSDQLNFLKKESTNQAINIITAVAKNISQIYGRKDDLKLELENTTLQISDLYLRRLIEEIVDNAFKYSKSGGTVEIIGICGNKNYSLMVIDNGIGLSEEQISQIGAFTQFNRLVMEQQGVGLGLDIVKKIVSLHEGEIEIESIPGKQTLVKVVLPRSAD